MSGTLGVTPPRTIGVGSARRVISAVGWRLRLVRDRGGLTTSVAVPVALVLTAVLVVATVFVASVWVIA